MNVCLLISYFSTNNSIMITKSKIRNKHLNNTSTSWHSSREIKNFRPQLSQKRPAKSWGDCIVKWWAHVMSLGKYPAFSQVIRGALSIFHGPLVESSFSLMGDVIDTKISN